MSRYQENTRHKRMWIGTQHHSEWITCPLRGAEMSPESWGTEGTYLSGGGFVRQSQDSHRQYIFEWSGASSRASAEIMQAYRDGVYNKTPSDLIYFIDPLMYSRNILPKRWAQPGILTVPGEAEYSSIGVVAPVDTPVSVLGNQKVPMVGAQVSSPFTTLNSFRGAINPGAGSVWVPIPEGETLTIIAWTGNPATSESGLYVKAQTTGGSWRDPQEVNPLGVTITGAKGVLLAAVGMFDFYGARAVIGRGEGWTEPVVYDWTGSPNNSTSTRTTPEGVVTNLFTNPDMVLSSTNTVVRQNLLPHPAPPQDRNTTNPPGWTITRGGSAIAALTDLLRTGGKYPPEGLSGIKGVRSGSFGNAIFPSDPPPIEFISGADAESRASVTSGTTYYASMYMWKRGWEGEKAEMPVRAVIRWYNSSGNAISDSVGSDVDLSDGGWGLLEVSGSAPSGAVSAAVIGQLEGLSGFLPSNHYTYATGAILQTSPGPYFDGDFSLQDGTTAWSGTPGESPSSETVDLGSEVVVWENLARQAQAKSSTFGRFSTGTGGDYDIAWLTNQADGPLPEITNYARATAVTPATSGSGGWNDHNIESSRAPLEGSAGDTVTMSIWMRYTGSLETYTVYFRVYAYSGTSTEHGQQSFDIPSGEWVRLSHTITPEESYDSVGFWAYFTGGDDIDAGGTIDVTGKMVTKGEHLLHYFDETFSPDPDLTAQPRPGGGSQLVGTEVANVVTSGDVAVIQSTRWSKSGGTSLRIIQNGPSSGWARVTNMDAATAVVWRYQEDTNLTWYNSGWGGRMGWDKNRSNPAPNVPGEHLLRVTGGPQGSNTTIYLSHHIEDGIGKSVWYDLLTVTDTEGYDGPPFSGSSPNEGPKWLPGSGNSGCKFVGNPTWIANSGVNGGQIGYAATLKEVGDWQL